MSEISQQRRPWYAWLLENYTPIMMFTGVIMFMIGVVLLLGWGGFFMIAGVVVFMLGLLSQ